MVKFCIRCGKQIPENSSKCPVCGQNLDALISVANQKKKIEDKECKDYKIGHLGKWIDVFFCAIIVVGIICGIVKVCNFDNISRDDLPTMEECNSLIWNEKQKHERDMEEMHPISFCIEDPVIKEAESGTIVAIYKFQHEYKYATCLSQMKMTIFYNETNQVWKIKGDVKYEYQWNYHDMEGKWYDPEDNEEKSRTILVEETEGGLICTAGDTFLNEAGEKHEVKYSEIRNMKTILFSRGMAAYYLLTPNEGIDKMVKIEED